MVWVVQKDLLAVRPDPRPVTHLVVEMLARYQVLEESGVVGFPTINLPATRPNSTRSFQNGGIRTRRILGFSTANDAIMPNNHVSIILE